MGGYEMRNRLMAVLAAAAMLGVLGLASPASAFPGSSFCSFSGAPSGEPTPEAPGNNAGEQIRFFRDSAGGPPPAQAPSSTGEWIPVGRADFGTGLPPVPSQCNPNVNPVPELP